MPIFEVVPITEALEKAGETEPADAADVKDEAQGSLDAAEAPASPGKAAVSEAPAPRKRRKPAAKKTAVQPPLPDAVTAEREPERADGVRATVQPEPQEVEAPVAARRDALPAEPAPTDRRDESARWE